MGILSKLFGGSSENQISDRGVKWLIDHVHEVQTEILQFVEPGTHILPECQTFLPNLLAEFDDPKLGIVHGQGGGHAFLRVQFLKTVLRASSGDIHDYASLVKAFREKGFNVKKVQYVSFE